MTDAQTPPARILVVEDEYLIRMLLEDMLGDLGHDVTASVGSVPEARGLAHDGAFDCAILDVNVDGQEIFPVADILAKRGMPFVFVTGYGEGSLPDAYRDRPTLQKPFQSEHLAATLTNLLSLAQTP
ncbi:MAG: response regulator [Rhodopseudomonas sp.]|nr:response regulator [Rhodopseudomonas sp.]